MLCKPPYSKVVVVIVGLSFSNCSISLIVGGKLILSIFNRWQHFNIFLYILSKFSLPRSLLKTDISVAYKKQVLGFIVAFLSANFFGAGINLLAVGRFIT